MIRKPKEHSITDDELTEVVDFIKFWTTAFRNGCSEKDRSRLSGIIRILDTIRTRSHLHLAPVQQERYTGICAVQDKCMDYADFIESIMDEIDNEDDDIPCPIKCAKRVNPNSEQQYVQPDSPEVDAVIFMVNSGDRIGIANVINGSLVMQITGAIAGEIRALQNVLEHQLIGNRHYDDVHSAFERFNKVVASPQGGDRVHKPEEVIHQKDECDRDCASCPIGTYNSCNDREHPDTIREG